MQELGYDRIWDCGQTAWVWEQLVNNQTTLKINN